MKYLLVLGVVALGALLWRSGRRPPIEREERPASPVGGDPQEMVRCAQCGLHLPRGDAIAGSAGRYYCSREHRLKTEP